MTQYEVIELFSGYLSTHIRSFHCILSYIESWCCTALHLHYILLSVHCLSFLYCFHWIIWLHRRPISEFCASLW